jgi:hypothetical protein
MKPHNPPGRISQNDNGDLAVGQILLIPNSLVPCEQEVESSCLRQFEQIPIGNPVPTAIPRLRHFMRRKRTGYAAGSSMVKKNAHSTSQPRQRELEARQGCERQIPARPESVLASHETARRFPLCWSPPRDFQKPWRLASGYREIPTRRCVGPARFRQRNIVTNQVLPSSQPLFHRNSLGAAQNSKAAKFRLFSRENREGICAV